MKKEAPATRIRVFYFRKQKGFSGRNYRQTCQGTQAIIDHPGGAGKVSIFPLKPIIAIRTALDEAEPATFFLKGVFMQTGQRSRTTALKALIGTSLSGLLRGNTGRAGKNRAGTMDLSISHAV